MTTAVNTQAIKEEVVTKLMESFGFIVSEEKVAANVATLSTYVCRDKDVHLVTYHSATKEVFRVFYNSTYMSGNICMIRTGLIRDKLRKLNLPRDIDGAQVDFLTVVSILASMMYKDFETAEGQVALMSKFMHWVYS